jgi:hypothetical protein
MTSVFIITVTLCNFLSCDNITNKSTYYLKATSVKDALQKSKNIIDWIYVIQILKKYMDPNSKKDFNFNKIINDFIEKYNSSQDANFKRLRTLESLLNLINLNRYNLKQYKIPYFEEEVQDQFLNFLEEEFSQVPSFEEEEEQLLTFLNEEFMQVSSNINQEHQISYDVKEEHHISDNTLSKENILADISSSMQEEYDILRKKIFFEYPDANVLMKYIYKSFISCNELKLIIINK